LGRKHLKIFRGRICRGPFYFAVCAVSGAEIGWDTDTTFAALLSAKAGVGLARLDKIYERYICMGTGRHGSRFDSGGHFGFIWRQENS
jgi:hypothetical protein